MAGSRKQDQHPAIESRCTQAGNNSLSLLVRLAVSGTHKLHPARNTQLGSLYHFYLNDLEGERLIL
jgi:hypothetical protein